MKIGQDTVEFRKMISPEYKAWQKEYYDFIDTVTAESKKDVELYDNINDYMGSEAHQRLMSKIHAYLEEHPSPDKYLKPEDVPYYRLYIFDNRLCKPLTADNYTYSDTIRLVEGQRLFITSKSVHYVAFPRKYEYKNYKR